MLEISARAQPRRGYGHNIGYKRAGTGKQRLEQTSGLSTPVLECIISRPGDELGKLESLALNGCLLTVSTRISSTARD
jgi:hypothetical protein